MQHLSVNLEKACVTVFNMYHVTINTGLDEIKDEYSLSHASYQANFVIFVPCTVVRLSGCRKVHTYTDATDHLLLYITSYNIVSLGFY